METPTSLNCRPGDLAIQIGGTPPLDCNIGTIYDVVELFMMHGEWLWTVIPHSDVKVLRFDTGELITCRAGGIGTCVADVFLRPLRGAEDEFITVTKELEHER